MRLIFATEPKTDADLEYRESLLDSWVRTAQGLDGEIVDRGDYYRVGNTVYVRTGAAMRQAFGEMATNKLDRQILGVDR